jgi:hypothetical protein
VQFASAYEQLDDRVTSVIAWMLAGILGIVSLLYLYWGLGGKWLTDKASPVVDGKPLVRLSRISSLGAALGTFFIAAVPVVLMRPCRSSDFPVRAPPRGKISTNKLRTFIRRRTYFHLGGTTAMTLANSLTAALMTCALLGAADSRTVDKTLPLPPTGSVTIDSHNGSISVNTWDRPEIQIHAVIEMNSGFSSSDDDRRRFNETRIDITGTGDSVRIESDYPKGDWLKGSNPEIHYTVNAPRTARWTIRTHNSRVEVHDLHAALSVTTHNGEIDVSGLAGALDLDTHNGNAKVQFASWTAPSSVDTHNGDIELVMPAASRFTLQTSSHNGRVQSDFAVTTRNIGRRGDHLDGTVNGGGPALRLTTHNGNFHLRAS